MPPNSLESLPVHILEEITALAVARDVGPPSGLLALLPVSRTVHTKLATSHVLARIFQLTFDTEAPLRRLGRASLTVRKLKTELVDRWRTLSRLKLRAPVPEHHDEAHDLWKAYLMLLEDDGKNVRHLLEYANVRGYVLDHFSRWLAAPSHPPQRWPAETPKNALCAWILALTDNYDLLVHESDDHKKAVQLFYLIYVYTVFMYPSAFAQWNIFHVPLEASSPAALDIARIFATPHPTASPRPSYVPASRVPSHFGDRRALAIPPLAHAAIAVVFARANGPLESQPEWMSDDIYAAHQTNWARGFTRWFGGPEGARSIMRDAEWRRLVHCADLYHGPVPGLEPMLEPGELQGRWDGFYRAPDLTQYESLIQAHNAPPPQWLVRPDVNDPPAYYKQTVQWRLREYHCLAGSGNIPLSADTDWAIDAWFPSTWTYDHLPNGTLRVWDPVRRAYTNYVPHAPNRTRAQVLDTIVLGQPDDDWKALWGDFTVYGRVRQADGLVVLRRDCMPPDAGLGRWLWYGYVHNGLNWIGRFRSTGVQVGLIAYAGSFMMARSQIS